jgi:hypothetical protein
VIVGTRIDSITGELFVSELEQNSHLRVRANSFDRPGTFAEVVIALTGANVHLGFSPPHNVQRGRTIMLDAAPHFGGLPTSRAVDWKITGNTTGITELTPIGGLRHTAELVIGASEPSGSVTITVTSVHDPEVSVVRTINLVTVTTPQPPANRAAAQAALNSITGRINHNSPAPGTPAFVVSSSASHARNTIRDFGDNASTSITAEAILSAVQSGLAPDVTIAWSNHTPFRMVQPTATAPGRITGVLVVRVGTSATAVLVDIEIPAEGAAPAAAPEPEPQPEPEPEAEPETEE